MEAKFIKITAVNNQAHHININYIVSVGKIKDGCEIQTTMGMIVSKDDYDKVIDLIYGRN